MDAVIRPQVTVVVATKEGTEGIGMYIQELAAYFYADDELVDSTQPERM